MAKETKKNLTWQEHVGISESVRKDEKWIRQLETDRENVRKELDQIEINLAYAKLWFAKHCLATKKGEAGRRHLVEAARLAAPHLTLWQSLDFFYAMFDHDLHDDVVSVIAERKGDFEQLSDKDTICELSWILIDAMWQTHRFEAYELYKLLPQVSIERDDTKCDDGGCWTPPAA